jgi:hypothetical protein
MNIDMQQKLGFIEFVNVILNRPGMFMIEDVEDLYLVLYGFQRGMPTHAEARDIAELMTDFRQFVNVELNSTDDVDWPRLIRYHSSGNSGSIILFKNKFERFIEIQNLNFLKSLE